jgi:hypothetical protein
VHGLEDLAFGITEDRQAYSEAALRSLTWLFPDHP